MREYVHFLTQQETRVQIVDVNRRTCEGFY
jgi:hypothetical protein